MFYPMRYIVTPETDRENGRFLRPLHVTSPPLKQYLLFIGTREGVLKQAGVFCLTVTFDSKRVSRNCDTKHFSRWSLLLRPCGVGAVTADKTGDRSSCASASVAHFSGNLHSTHATRSKRPNTQNKNANVSLRTLREIRGLHIPTRCKHLQQTGRE